MNSRTHRPRWIARCMLALAAMRQRARARRDLWTLDAYMLRDIGLSHHAAADGTRTPRPMSRTRDSVVVDDVFHTTLIVLLASLIGTTALPSNAASAPDKQVMAQRAS